MLNAFTDQEWERRGGEGGWDEGGWMVRGQSLLTLEVNSDKFLNSLKVFNQNILKWFNDLNPFICLQIVDGQSIELKNSVCKLGENMK